MVSPTPDTATASRPRWEHNGSPMREELPNDEQAWIAAAAAGRCDAFERLYRLHAGRVYAVCLRLCGNASEAEDHTQDAFVQAWKRLHAFRGESSFGTWLHRIAVNTVLAAGRARGRYESRVTTTDDLAPYERATASATPGLRMDLDAAIQKLPPGARAVFVLFDIEGYRHEEIATLLGIAEGTSKAHLHHARRLLREALTP